LPPRFLIYFATPAYFSAGWQPQNWRRFFEGNVTLQAAAVNRFQSLGGFDWAKDPRDPLAHKPARRYVPAGAVYFFTSEGQARLKPDLIQNAIADVGAEIGFGQILIGGW
jgi:CRISPR-associated protein Cmr3